MRSKFRAGNGKFFTKQLFWEEWVNLPIEARAVEWPMYSLHRDRPNSLNFGKRYVELRDPTGYKIAQELLESYDHWTALMSCKWFLTAKEIWDRELEALLKSEALEKMRLLMDKGLPAQQLAAAKYFANKEYTKDPSFKGRPRKEDIERAAKEMAAQDADVLADLQRIQNVKSIK